MADLIATCSRCGDRYYIGVNKTPNPKCGRCDPRDRGIDWSSARFTPVVMVDRGNAAPAGSAMQDEEEPFDDDREVSSRS